MSQLEKLFFSILSGTNDTNIRFADPQKIRTGVKCMKCKK